MSDQEMVSSSISAETPESEDDTVRVRAKQKIRRRRLGMAAMGWGIAATATVFTWWLGLLNFSAGEVVALLILIGLAL